jgi:Family of unknown function (DUF6345)
MPTLAQWLGEPLSVEIPRSVPIYEQQRRFTRPRDVGRLAAKFGIDRKPAEVADIHVAAKGKKVLVVHKAGPTFCYLDFSKLDNLEYRPELSSEQEANEAALRYLRKEDLLPKNAVVTAVRRIEFEQVKGRTRTRKTYPNHNCIDLRLSLAGLQTYGPGAKVQVLLGTKNEIIGLFHAVPRLRKIAEVRLNPPRMLRLALEKKLGVPPEQIELKDAKLAYLVESALSGNRMVHPTYILTLSTKTTSKRRDREVEVEFMTHPLPASRFAPVIVIKASRAPIEIASRTPLRLSATVSGGKAPYKIVWESNIDGVLGEGPRLAAKGLSIAHRERQVVCHTLKATVTDANGLQDSYSVLVQVQPAEGDIVRGDSPVRGDVPGDPFVGVEWCNLYHGAPGLADISGTAESAQGFKTGIQGLSNWSSRFDWGNDAAWEQDFKFLTAPGGGTDSYWADNVHFAFFAGHGGSGAFYFGSQTDDHQMAAEDAHWGDGILNWVVLHACLTMRANFEWSVWCDAFRGLHAMFGFHTITEGSTPPLGSRFAFWASLQLPFEGPLDLRAAWRLACSECFDGSVENAVIYANQAGTDTQNDHLPGFGYVSPDPSSPNGWVYERRT